MLLRLPPYNVWDGVVIIHIHTPSWCWYDTKPRRLLIHHGIHTSACLLLLRKGLTSSAEACVSASYLIRIARSFAASLNLQSSIRVGYSEWSLSRSTSSQPIGLGIPAVFVSRAMLPRRSARQPGNATSKQVKIRQRCANGKLSAALQGTTPGRQVRQ